MVRKFYEAEGDNWGGGFAKPLVSRRSSLKLLVEAEPGSSIERACSDATELANRLNITVKFKFNDVVCLAKPGGSAAGLATAFFEACEKDTPYKIAVG